MGIIQSGILSKVSGKVAGVVGGSWKDKAYLRAWVKPANPKTAAQVAQRLKFELAVAFSKTLVGQVFNAYTDRFIKSMSGFNFFIKNNIDKFVAPIDYLTVLLTSGQLSFLASVAGSYSNPNVAVTWSPNYGNNGLPTDGVFCAIYDKSTGVWYFSAAETDRSVGSDTIICPAGLTASDLTLWAWCAQYETGVLKRISDSYVVTCT